MGSMGWVEIVLFYGIAIGIGVWQFWKMDRMLKQTRAEKAAKEAAELVVLEAYLPARLSADEITAEVKAIVTELGAKGPGDMGKVMGAVKQRLAGQADMGVVSAAVKAALAG